MKIKRLSAEFISLTLLSISIAFMYGFYRGWLSPAETWIIGILIWVQTFLLIGVLLYKRFRSRNKLERLIDYVYSEFGLKHEKGWGGDQLEVLHKALEKLGGYLKAADTTLRHLKDGDHVNAQELIKSDHDLLKVIGEMNLHLGEVADAESKRKYFNETLASLNDLLSQVMNSKSEDLFVEYLKLLSDKLKMSQAALFLYNKEEETEKEYLELKEAYAWERQKYLNKKIAVTEGLVGQCYMEKDTILLSNLPKEYVQIKSGLGEAMPNFLLLVPVINQNKVYGVIEFASFKQIGPDYLELAKAAADRLGTSLASLDMALRTKFLLAKSQKANRDMQETEEMMRTNMEELFKMQDEMNGKIKQLEESSEYTKQLFDVIDINNAFIEYDVDGCVVDMSKQFMKEMGYQETDKEWLKFQDMLALDAGQEITPEAYWSNIIQSKKHSDNNLSFRSRDGRMHSSYSAFAVITNKRKKINKIIHIIHFNKLERLANLNQRNLMKVINHNLPMIEIDEKGKIMGVNKMFTTVLGFKEMEVLENDIVYTMLKNSAHNLITQLWKQARERYDASIELECTDAEGNSFPCKFIIHLPESAKQGDENLLLIMVAYSGQQLDKIF